MDRNVEWTDDERVVDLVDETEPPPIPATLDPDERVEDVDEADVAPLDDERI